MSQQKYCRVVYVCYRIQEYLWRVACFRPYSVFKDDCLNLFWELVYCCRSVSCWSTKFSRGKLAQIFQETEVIVRSQWQQVSCSAFWRAWRAMHAHWSCARISTRYVTEPIILLEGWIMAYTQCEECPSYVHNVHKSVRWKISRCSRLWGQFCQPEKLCTRRP